MNESATPTVQTGRIICGALLGGAVMFWAVALFVTEGGTNPLEGGLPVDSSVVTIAALVVGVAVIVGALVFRSKALASASSVTSRAGEPPPPEGVVRAHTNLTIAWALLEGYALLSGVVFMLTTLESLVVITAAILAFGLALTFPRAEWYGQAYAARP